MDSFFFKLIFAFGIINGIGFAFYHLIGSWGIIDGVGAAGNFLLAGITLTSYSLNKKALKSLSHSAFLRRVSVSATLKLVTCLAAVLAYVLIWSSQVNKATIFLLMGLYILYSILETGSLVRLSRPESHPPTENQ